ncbi:MAG TPA: hypothetical protein DCO82_05500, partial [Alphaproteobacteria bacterium]|nr:hypothetical protein [Alphaproteobacteria bacterium]
CDLSTSIGDHTVVVTTGNGYGSTNTKIRRYSAVQVNTGTAITYADSAANGASFTINETGIYAMTALDLIASGALQFGISRNSSQLTTAVDSITAADRLAYTSINTGGNTAANVSVTRLLMAGYVIRVHAGTGNPDTARAWQSGFTICKVGL